MSKKQNVRNKMRLQMGPLMINLETAEGKTVIGVVLVIAVLLFVLAHK